jgi:acetyl esterase/lipase
MFTPHSHFDATRRISVCAKVAIAASFIILCCRCPGRLPENFCTQFAGWFISPDPAKRASLCSRRFGPPHVDSVVSRIREKQGPVQPHARTLYDSTGDSYIVGILPPRSFSADSAYPLVIYLHGGIGTSALNKGEKAYMMLAGLLDSCDVFIASPSANRFAPWWSATGLNRILQTVRLMTLEYPVDDGRIILAGVSDGATGCYAAANTIAGPFAGFIAVSGFGGMLPRLGIPVIPSNLMQRPIYNVNAGRDHLYPIAMVDQFLDWLTQQGVRVERKVYGEEEHGFDYRDREMGELVRKIRTWRRPEENTVSWTIVPGLPYRADNLLSCTTAGPAGDEYPRITARFEHDSLFIDTYRIMQADIYFRGADARPIAFFSTSSKTAAADTRPGPCQMLDIMQQACRPVVEQTVIYHFSFTEK